eukprot:1191333-Prorocentrum_minimum.AAC.2
MFGTVRFPSRPYSGALCQKAIGARVALSGPSGWPRRARGALGTIRLARAWCSRDHPIGARVAGALGTI